MPGTRSHNTEFYTGDYRALESEFVSRVRDLRAADALAPLLVIVTSRLLGLHLDRHLAEAGVSHVNIRFLTIGDLAEHVAGPVLHREGKTRMPGFAAAAVMAEALRLVANETGEFYFAAISERPGFHKAMLSTIRDLEEALLTPRDLKAMLKTSGARREVHSKKIEDLARTWERYRSLLDDTGWVDDYRIMQTAAEHLATCPVIGGASGVLIYGFYDLNTLQRKLLAACSEVKDTIAFVPFDQQRAFAFAKPTLRWMKSRGFHAKTAGAPGVSEESPTLAHMRKHVFEDTAEPAQYSDAVTFVSAPGEVREVREIVRVVTAEAHKRDLGAHEVAIILRNTEGYGDILRDILERLNIKPYMPEGKTLSETPEGRTVLLLLDAHASNYARREVMEFITFASLKGEYLRGADKMHVSVHIWDAVSMNAGIVEGSDTWLERLDRLLAETGARHRPGASGDSDTRRFSFDAGDIRSLRDFMAALIHSLSRLEAAKTWAEKSTRLIEALQDLTEQGDNAIRICEALGQLKDLDILSSPPQQSEFLQAVRDIVGGERLPQGRFQHQGPAVLSLMAARGIPFEMVVIPGMVEKNFPPIIRQDAILLDHEREALNQAGAGGGTGPLHLKSKSRLDEERLLFRLAIGAARQRLVLSFPRLAIGATRERLPSSFVLAAVEALTGRKADFDSIETEEGFKRVPLAEIAVKEPADAVDQVEFDLAAAVENIREATPEDILYMRKHSAFFSDGLRLEAMRWGKPFFTSYDGILAGTAARRLLKRDYAIVGRKVSPTRLEAYASCPFSYLIGFILGIEPLVEPEYEHTISPIEKGTLVHSILWEFFTTLKERRNGPVTVKHDDLILLLKIALERFKGYEQTGVVGYPAMWDLEKERMLTCFDDFIEDEATLSDFHPAYFEVRYGMRRRIPEESEISVDEPAPLEFGSRKILLRGRIDRIDVSEDGREVRVVDYKTGKPHAKADDFQGGTTLQLPLYLHAAGHILKRIHPDIEALYAEYYHLGVQGKGRHIGFSGDCLNHKRDELVSILDTIADGIEQGLFFPIPGERCRLCGFDLICGPYRRQVFDRKIRDPNAESFLKMRGEIEEQQHTLESDR